VEGGVGGGWRRGWFRVASICVVDVDDVMTRDVSVRDVSVCRVRDRRAEYETSAFFFPFLCAAIRNYFQLGRLVGWERGGVLS